MPNKILQFGIGLSTFLPPSVTISEQVSLHVPVMSLFIFIVLVVVPVGVTHETVLT